MNISRFIKRILNKEDNTYIINMQDAFVLPEKSAFNDNPKMISLIDSKKEEYLNILKNKKLFFTKDLSATLKEEILIKVDIILNEFLKSENKRMDTRVFISKLMLYMNDLINYEKEVLSSSIALKEIINEKILLSKNKKELLNNELNNLLNLLVILNSQKAAINTRINSYKAEYIYEKHEFDSEELNNRYEYLCYLKDKEIEQIEETQEIVAIALMEKELEEYAYKNTDKTKEIENDIYYMNYYNLGINKYNVKEDIETYNEHKKIIEKDERQVLIFIEFGKNLINEETVERFYNEKFKVLTYNIFNKEYIDINEEDKGFNYYLKIVEERYTGILNKNIQYTSLLYNTDLMEKIANLFKNLLNSVSKNYEKLYEFILTHGMYLSFLLSLESKEELNVFFEKTIVNARLIRLSNTFPPLKLKKELSLNTVIKLKKQDYLVIAFSVNTEFFINDRDRDFKDFCEVYNELNKYKYKDLKSYEIPEGIINIYRPFSLKHDLLLNIEPKGFIDIKLPTSLKDVSDEFFAGVKINTLYLNENLITISASANKLSHRANNAKYYIKNIVISPSIESISENIFKSNECINSITFKDFNDSIYLKKNLEKFIESLLTFHVLVEDSEITMYGIGFKESAREASFEEVINNNSKSNIYEALFKIKYIYLEQAAEVYRIDLQKITKQFSFYNEKILSDFKKYFIEEVKRETGINLESNSQIKVLTKTNE